MSTQYQSRMRRVLEEIEAAGMDFAMITSPGSIFYLTGFYSDPHERFMALIARPGEAGYMLFVPALDEESARRGECIGRLVAVHDTVDPWELLGKETGFDPAVIGVEKNHLRFAGYERLSALYPKASYLDAHPIVMQLRLRKTPEEIARVRTAVALAERVLEEAVAKAGVGVSELELNAEIEYRLRVLGGDKPAFETSVLGGTRSALPHGRSGEYRLQEDDFLLIDMGVYKDGYCSDITRTFLIGEGSGAQARVYEAVLQANRSAVAAAMAGRPLADVDRAARETITEFGFGHYFNHRVGHGMGIDIHELPSVHGGNESPIEPGMLFTIEPGVYVPDIGGVRIEDDIYIGEDGRAQVLTSFPRELRRL